MQDLSQVAPYARWWARLDPAFTLILSVALLGALAIVVFWSLRQGARLHRAKGKIGLLEGRLLELETLQEKLSQDLRTLRGTLNKVLGEFDVHETALAPQSAGLEGTPTPDEVDGEAVAAGG